MSALQYAGNHRSLWGEGPVFYQGLLFYVDIEAHQVLTYDPASGREQAIDVGERVGTVVPRASGGMVIAGDSGFRFLGEDGSLTDIVDPESDIPDNRFNDGKCDPSGRFWAGTISTVRIAGSASLYRLDSDLTVTRQLDNVTNSNGLCWSGDRSTMFYIDTPRKEIWAFDYDDSTGKIDNRRTVVDTRPFAGSPDGMTIDVEDNLWVAFCKGSAVRCFAPEASGKQLHSISLPTTCPTAVAFGGPSCQDLFITTGQHSTDSSPQAGRLYVTRPGIAGQKSFAFAG